MEKKYGFKKGGYHKIKQDIIKDLTNKNSPYKDFMKKVGNNPDVHLSQDGTIRIVSTKYKGKSFDTTWKITDYLD